jgi:adenylate cyclase
MFKTFLRNIFWAGIDRSSSHKVSVKRITNVTAVLVVLSLLIQIPIVLIYWNINGLIKLTVVLVHILAISSVPLLNANISFYLARSTLIVGFTSYLILSSILWAENINSHYFFLLGIFVCSFIYYAWEDTKAIGTMFIFCLCFIFPEFIWLGSTASEYNDLTVNDIVRLANSFVLMMAILSTAIFIRSNTNMSWMKINNEKERSNQLLCNTLPTQIVDKLRCSDSQLATFHSSVSVLFADIKGFSALCKNSSATSTVNFLNELFSFFDDITDHFKLEKIKTNGDEYMAVAGAPEYQQLHAIDACLCAEKMLSSFTLLCEKHHLDLGLRIGIASGEAIAGVIGKSKYSYDIWGETVNFASRMESHGIAGKIQVDSNTFVLAKQQLKFQFRGIIEIKNMGDHPTYWLNSDNHHV